MTNVTAKGLNGREKIIAAQANVLTPDIHTNSKKANPQRIRFFVYNY